MPRQKLEQRKELLKKMRENYILINKDPLRLDYEINSIEQRQRKNNISLKNYIL